MELLFPPETYSSRRNSLIRSLDKGVVFIPGNGESPINYTANAYPFRQDSSFLYYFGIDRPDLNGAIDLDSGTSYLFGNERSVGEVVWMGDVESLKELGRKIRVDKVLSLSDMEDLFKGRKALCLPTYRPEHGRALRNAFGVERFPEPSTELIQAVVAQRSIKEKQEIAEMDSALRVSAEMHLEVMKACRTGTRESTLAARAFEIARKADRWTAYPIILTVDGQILHNHHYQNTLKTGQFVLGDFGAESAMHYASDITRTTPVDLRFSQQQKEIYQIVLDTQEGVIRKMRSGVSFRDLHLHASRIIAEGLKGLGLMKGNPDEAVEQGAHALFFPHGLGHMIGLDVHDMEGLGEEHVGYGTNFSRSGQFGLSALRMARVLEPGMVVTVEPGIYFIPALIDQWQKENRHKDFIAYEKLGAYLEFGGVRIEDNLLVEGEKAVVIGPAIPKKVEEIEALC